jgi:hypothetical protein
MPISYHIDKNQAAVFTTVSGTVDDEELVGHARALSSDPEVQLASVSLIDFRDVEEIDTSPDGVRRVVLIFREIGYAPKSALVADRDATFGMARMYELMRGDAVSDVQVFREVDEAKKWLGIS